VQWLDGGIRDAVGQAREAVDSKDVEVFGPDLVSSRSTSSRVR
jgi:hypothetical protein